MSVDIEAWHQDRNAALLSMDKAKIQAYLKKWNKKEMQCSEDVFWGAVHKAITGAPDLPINFRRISKAWLDAQGLSSFDDGDL
jgi:hypothetical protein